MKRLLQKNHQQDLASIQLGFKSILWGWLYFAEAFFRKIFQGFIK